MAPSLTSIPDEMETIILGNARDLDGIRRDVRSEVDETLLDDSGREFGSATFYPQGGESSVLGQL